MKKIYTLFLIIVCANLFAQTWSGVGSGISGGLSSNVSVISSDSNYLYAGGNFTYAGGNTANYIARWDGFGWSALGNGLNYEALSMTFYNNELLVGGSFTTAGGQTANYIASWNGSSWLTLGSGVNNSVRCMAVYNNDLYIGGNFNNAGGNNAYYVAKWNGSQWSAVGNGTDGEVTSMIVFNNELYIGGSFTTAGGINVNNFAKWNGSSWSSVNTGTNIYPTCFAVCNNSLYVGYGGLVGKWDGSLWTSIGGAGESITSITNYNNTIYASFHNLYSSDFSYLHKLVGDSWIQLGDPVHQYLVGLTVFSNVLFACGNFDSPVYKIAMFTEFPIPIITYSDLSICQGNYITFIDSSFGPSFTRKWIFENGNPNISTEKNQTVFYNNPGTFDVTLIATNPSGSDTLLMQNYITIFPNPPTPTINNAGNVLASSSATGNQWYIDSNIITGAINQLYVAQTQGSYMVAVTDSNGCMSFSVPLLITSVNELTDTKQISVYPNPANDKIEITGLNNGIIELINAQGQIVKTLNTSNTKTTIDISKLSGGVYTMKIKTDNGIIVKKLIIQ